MEHGFRRLSGISLIIGCLLLVLTMILHPVGGSLERILQIYNIIVLSHSLAIASLPFVGFGFYGLSVALTTPSRSALLAFFSAAMGLLAAMIAGTMNGLTLPFFLSHYADNLDQDPEVLRRIVNYGFSINKPMDYIFMAAISFAVAVWSLLIIRTAVFPRWVGYYGLLLLLLGFAGILADFNFISVSGFRVLVFGLVSWILAVGVFLTKAKG